MARSRRSVPRGARRVLAWAAGGAVLATAARAHAEMWWMGLHLSPGVVYSWAQGPVEASGAGFEVTAGYTSLLGASFADWWWAPHAGGFFRAHWYDDDVNDYRRLAAGLQGGLGLLGVEAGYAHRSDFGAVASTDAFHLAPYLSVGLLYAGPQFSFPTDGAPTEVSVNLGVKFPLPQLVVLPALAMSDFGKIGHGRPVRVGGQVRTAPVVQGTRWRAGRGRPEVAALAPALREQLARLWLTDARLEHASVAAFAKLSLELLAVGAPPALVAAAQRAGLDEVRHAELCFALASAYTGTPLDPGPLALGAGAPSSEPDLARLAAESFYDGCVGEGAAAASARAAARGCVDPAVRTAWHRMARDEARHAKLGWQIVHFCIARGGSRVCEVLEERRDALEQRLEVSKARAACPADAGAREQLARGRLDADAERRVFERTARACVRRLARMLEARSNAMRCAATLAEPLSSAPGSAHALSSVAGSPRRG